MSSAGRRIRASRALRSLAGLVDQVGPVQVEQVEEERRSAARPRAARPPSVLARRPAGGDLERPRPAVRAERHRLPVEDGRPHVQAEHRLGDLREPGAVMSSRVRVKTATSAPSRCTWIRIPSIFHSTAAGETRSKAAPRCSPPRPRASAAAGARPAGRTIAARRPRPASAESRACRAARRGRPGPPRAAIRRAGAPAGPRRPAPRRRARPPRSSPLRARPGAVRRRSAG